MNLAPDARTRPRSAAAAAPSCDGCFFRRHTLCALDRSEPCATYRPDREGLRPPRQMAFAFRPERATGTPFAFPDAHEQHRRYRA